MGEWLSFSRPLPREGYLWLSLLQCTFTLIPVHMKRADPQNPSEKDMKTCMQEISEALRYVFLRMTLVPRRSRSQALLAMTDG